ncbi:MAG: hypothetical protein QM803_09995 [Rhodocyclaceae bacterium]
MKSIRARHVVQLAVAAAFIATQSAAWSANVPRQKSDQISAGQSQDDVVKLIGKPNRTVKMRNGNTSLVYDAEPTTGNQRARLVVEIDSAGKVVSSTVQNTNE